ncbi:hybrid sensor histidine kinase/response regulator [Zobellella maritima]|uniref:hybrid sensor histidine kinase/response regulator n=1 Tax=Zobellella maritima TaxID=2059725 RepID=UPI000E30B0B5|nr:hybrid sensor histidine kinase/response regulator [Zobellella maritima]
MNKIDADHNSEQASLTSFLQELASPEVWELLSSQAGGLLDAIENIAEAFVYWDADDRLVLCNRKYPLQFMEPDKVRPGVRFSELVEQNIRTGRVISFNEIENVPESPAAYRKRRMEMHRQGKGSFEVKNHDGRWLQARERRTRDGGTVGIYTDITEIKEAERREHAAALAAEQANQAKSRFLAAASHDLRQPLHAMGILLGALEGRLRHPSERELLQDIDSCLQTMQSLFDSLLDVSRLDAGVLRPQPQRLELDTFLKAMEREFAPQAHRQSLSFRVRHSPYCTWSDPAMLGRVLRNLIGNAIKYTDHGGVLVAARIQGRQLALEVWDTGIGFPEEQLEVMFGEFRQLEVGQVRRQGLGLGLSIANRLSQMLEHKIEVRSVVGRGSLFRVLVPLHGSSQAESVPCIPVPPVEHNAFDLRVLVIDDEPDNLHATATLLEGWGYRVDLAASLEQASRLPHCPDFILADYHLQAGTQGTDVIACLSRHFKCEIPAVIVTGDTEPEQLRHIQSLGYPVVHKPLKPIRLRALLQRQQADRF